MIGHISYKWRRFREMYQHLTKGIDYKWHKYIEQHNSKCNNTGIENFLFKKGTGWENQPKDETKNNGKKNIKEWWKQQLTES